MTEQLNSHPRLNHDDRALYLYLNKCKGATARQLFYQVIRARIAQYEAQQGRKWVTVKSDVITSFSLFWTAVEAKTFAQQAAIPPWFAFLSFYRLQTKRTFSRPKDSALNYRYCSRDVLLRALAEDKEQVTGPLNAAYEAPAKKTFYQYYPSDNSEVIFNDIYQDAFIDLLRKPPDPVGKHSAQLFSIFRQILMRRAADAYRKKPKPLPEIVNTEADGNNSNDFTDYVIDKYHLKRRFASDDPIDIVKKGMNRLGKNCQELLQLRFFRGKRYREIAEILAYSTDSVGQRIKRCLRKMRVELFHS